MADRSECIIVTKVDINEGLRSGTVTKAALVATTDFLFVIPYESVGVLGNVVTTASGSGRQLIVDLEAELPDLAVRDLEMALGDALPQERVHPIADLEHLSVQVGFWIFGGLRYKPRGAAKKVVNVQPAALRAELKALWGLD